MIDKVNSFLVGCVEGFDRAVKPIPQGVVIPEDVVKILTELECPPPEALDSIVGKVQDLKVLKNVVTASISFQLAGIVCLIGAIALSILGASFPLPPMVGIAGLALFLGAECLNTIYKSKNEDIDHRITDLKEHVSIIGAWCKKINATKKQNNLSDEQVKTLDKALAWSLKTAKL